MEGNKLVWILGIGAGGYLLYTYGVSQGWWGSLSGPSVPTTVLTAAQQQALITQGTAAGLTSAQIQTALNQIQTMATACGAAWNPATGTCGSSTSTAAPPLTTVTTPAAPVTTSGTPTAVAPVAATPPAARATRTPAGITAAQLIAAAGVSANSTFDADQWNYYETQINPAAQVTDFSAQGWIRTAGNTTTNPGVTQMTAAQYITLRQSAGLSGMWDPTGYDWVVPNPYGLVTDNYDYAYAGD